MGSSQMFSFTDSSSSSGLDDKSRPLGPWHATRLLSWASGSATGIRFTEWSSKKFSGANSHVGGAMMYKVSIDEAQSMSATSARRRGRRQEREKLIGKEVGRGQKLGKCYRVSSEVEIRGCDGWRMASK